MFLAVVLVGEYAVGRKNEYPPPVKPHSMTSNRFETTVDNTTDPSIFVTYKDGQAYPLYLVQY